jgi:hypothetical protein
MNSSSYMPHTAGTTASVSSDTPAATHLVLTFDCNGTKGVGEIAQRSLQQLETLTDHSPTADAAITFLRYLRAGHGIVGGSKGSRFSWAHVAVGVDPRAFAELLRPFWTELLGHFSPPIDWGWDGPLYYDSVILLHQQERGGAAGVIDVWNRGTWRTRTVDLVITDHPALLFSLLSA